MSEKKEIIQESNLEEVSGGKMIANNLCPRCGSADNEYYKHYVMESGYAGICHCPRCYLHWLKDSRSTSHMMVNTKELLGKNKYYPLAGYYTGPIEYNPDDFPDGD